VQENEDENVPSKGKARGVTRFEKLIQSGLHSVTGRGPESHLNPDQLSTFLEGDAAGRDRVIEHASRCAECREALYLLSGERVAAAPTRLAKQWRLAWIPAVAAVCALAVLFPLYLRRGASRNPVVIARALPSTGMADRGAPVEPKTFVPPVRQGEIARFPRASTRFVEPPKIQPMVHEPPALPGQIVLTQPEQNARIGADFAETAQPLPGQMTLPLAQQSFRPSSMRAMQALVARRALDWIVIAGAVQRSADAGSTWRPVSIDPGTRFQAIASFSNEVWAGGDGGALFHSSDYGEHWNSIAVSFKEDVTAIQIVNRREVRLQTSGDQRWLTADGGKTWTPE